MRPLLNPNTLAQFVDPLPIADVARVYRISARALRNPMSSFPIIAWRCGRSKVKFIAM